MTFIFWEKNVQAFVNLSRKRRLWSSFMTSLFVWWSASVQFSHQLKFEKVREQLFKCATRISTHCCFKVVGFVKIQAAFIWKHQICGQKCAPKQQRQYTLYKCLRVIVICAIKSQKYWQIITKVVFEHFCVLKSKNPFDKKQTCEIISERFLEFARLKIVMFKLYWERVFSGRSTW